MVDSHLIAYPQSSGDLINIIYPSRTSEALHSQAYLPPPGSHTRSERSFTTTSALIS
jgi:hypothetical protein